MVRVLTFYTGDPSSNPAEAYRFKLYKLCLKRMKINKKRPGLAHFKIVAGVDYIIRFFTFSVTL